MATKNTQNLPQSEQHSRNMAAVGGQSVGEQGTGDEGKTELQMVIDKFDASRKYARRGFWDTWDNAFKLYNNQRIMVGYDGNTDAFTPETFTIIQAVKAHIVGGNLNIKFLPRHQDQNGDTTVLQDLFNYAWERDFMDAKIDQTVDGMLVCGNRYIFTFVGEGGFPTNRVVDAKDCFFNPDATNYWSLRYWGFRYMTTIDELRDETVFNVDYDPDKPEGPDNPRTVKRFKDLDQIQEGFKGNGSDKTAKELREEMTAGAILEDRAKVVEVICYWDYDRQIYIANRNVEIENIETPFKRAAKKITSIDDTGNPVVFTLPEVKPFANVAPFRDYIDENLWYAKGEVEIIGESQERLNDVVVQKSDNLSYILNRMWTLDPAFAQKLEEIQNMPGAVFTVPPGALDQVTTQPIGPDADNEIARIKQEMRAATAADEIIQGQQVSGDATATEIRSTIAQAGTRFNVKLRTIENEGMRILALNMWKVMQIYIDRELAIRVEGNDSSKFRLYNPGQYLGDWDVKIQLAPTAESIKETERQMAMQFYLLASKQNFVDQKKLFVETAIKQFDKNRQQVLDMFAPPPMTPPPIVMPKLIETLKFEQLYPDEQAQVLAESGVIPSPKRELESGRPNPPALTHPKNVILPPDAGGGPQQDFTRSDVVPAGQRMANIPGVPQA